MAYDVPLWLQAKTGDPAVTYSATQDRALVDALISRSGVLSQGAWLVSQRAAGANFSVDVAGPGYGVVTGTSVTGQGKYLLHSTAVQNVTITAAPGSGTRTDLIVAQVTDPQADGTSVYGWSFVAVAGPDTAGTVPTVPANSLVLAQLTIPAGLASITSANIADKRPFAAGYGPRPAAQLARNSATTLSLATGTLGLVVNWDFGFTYGPNGGITNTTGGVFTVPVAGLYVWSSTVFFPSPASAYRNSVIPMINGSEPANDYGRVDVPAVVGSGTTAISAGGHVPLNAGDTFQIAVYQNSGSTISVSPRTFGLHLVA